MENIFISHIHEEALLAVALKHWLEKTTAGQWKVFVSSDRDNITLGENWFAKIEGAQAAQKTFIVLCSPASKLRPWINYETGYAAAKGVPILPLRHSGLEENALPPFLSRWQGIEITSNGFVKSLFEALQKHVPLLGEPHIPEQQIANAIKKALTKILKQSALPSTGTANSSTIEIEDGKCIEIFTALALTEKGRSTHFSLTQQTGLNRIVVDHCLNRLLELGLIFDEANDAGGTSCELTEAGKAYAVKKGYVK